MAPHMAYPRQIHSKQYFYQVNWACVMPLHSQGMTGNYYLSCEEAELIGAGNLGSGTFMDPTVSTLVDLGESLESSYPFINP